MMRYFSVYFTGAGAAGLSALYDIGLAAVFGVLTGALLALALPIPKRAPKR